MAKINISKPTGNVETLTLLSAFKVENNTYVIFDSERTGSMGLPIIYVSKLTERLIKITDDTEWLSAKNYLKGIISGTNFEYIRISENLSADEAFYTPLTLPNASYDTIKSRYIVNDGASLNSGGAAPTLQPLESVPVNEMPTAPVAPSINQVTPVSPVEPVTPVAPVSVASVNSFEPPPSTTPEVGTPMSFPAQEQPVPATPNIGLEPLENVIPTSPVMPSATVESNTIINSTPINNEASPIASSDPIVDIPKESGNSTNFDNDKETFLKACENMFDALISKYQKQLADLEQRENEIRKKEQEIDSKLHNANEHLANAAAREQVANIAHDNAQKVMDLNNLMPTNPTNFNNPTGVI